MELFLLSLWCLSSLPLSSWFLNFPDSKPRVVVEQQHATTLAMTSKQSSLFGSRTKKQRVSADQMFKFWPSSLTRAGHTTLKVTDPAEPLHQFLTKVQPNTRYGMRMGRAATNVPCLLRPSSKFRHGAERWWCPVHQGQYGLKKQLELEAASGIQKCDQSHEPVDFIALDECRGV